MTTPSHYNIFDLSSQICTKPGSHIAVRYRKAAVGIAETNPTYMLQFQILRLKRPERLDVSGKSGGLLVYITEGIMHKR